MRAYVLPYRVLFHDTMAYGTHHFLTNLKFQCLCREHYYFAHALDRPGGSDAERRELHDSHVILTRDAYSANLWPVAVGERVAILMTIEATGKRSVRMCFRVVHESGKPVSAGYQTLIRIDRETHALLDTPDWVRAAAERIREPLVAPDLAARLHDGRFAEVFDPRTLALARQALDSELPRDGALLEAEAPAPRRVTVAPAPRIARDVHVFPGQGGYDPRPLAAALDAGGEPAGMVHAADAVGRELLGSSLVDHLRAGTPADAALSQLGIYALGAIGSARLTAAGTPPGAVFGHSFGEVAALAAAGGLSFADGAAIACHRALALRDCAAIAGAGGMLAVLAAPDVVRELVAHPTVRDAVIAVVNTDAQSAVSGPFASLEAVERRARSLGVATRRIRSPHPFHSPLLAPAVRAFAARISGIRGRPLTVPVYSAVERGWLAEDAAISDLVGLLTRQLTAPIDWPEAARAVWDAGGRAFHECGSGPLAVGFVARILAGRPGLSTRAPFAPRPTAITAPSPAQPRPSAGTERQPREPIAIVGLGCRLPNAADPDALWTAVLSRTSGLGDAGEAEPALVIDFLGGPRPAPDKATTLLGGLIRDPRLRDAAGAWRDAGPPSVLHGLFAEALVQARGALGEVARTQVVVGSTADGSRAYDEAVLVDDLVGLAGTLPFPVAAREALQRRIREVLAAGGEAATARTGALAPHAAYEDVAARVLGGQPTVIAVDAACASSLYAIDHGVRALRDGQADLAYCGGVFAPGPGNAALFSQFGGLSGTGSRPLDAGADGVVFGAGAAVVALRRLSDAVANGEHVYAVIRDIGLSSDGKGPSVAVPQVAGQVAATRRAWDRAGLDPATLDLLEAHATSTPVGDTVELRAIRAVFTGDSGRPAPLAIGSLKALTGHTGWAAGAASLIEVCLAIGARTLPPHPVAEPNPELAADPLLVAHPVALAWPEPSGGRPRRAAVSGFGFGGANAHVVVEEHRGGALQPWPAPVPARKRVAVVGVGVVRPADGVRFGAAELVLPPGRPILPDVIDDTDRSQLAAVIAAARALPAGVDLGAIREDTGVVVAASGKTALARRASHRVYRDRVARRLREENGVPVAIVDALVGAVDALPPTGPYTLPGMMPNVAAGRVASFFDLMGPNLAVDAGPDSLAAALDVAAGYALDDVCRVVLAGGVATSAALDGVPEAAVSFALASEPVARTLGLGVLAVIEVGGPAADDAGAEPMLDGADGLLAAADAIARAGQGDDTLFACRSGRVVRIAPPGARASDPEVTLPPLLAAVPALDPCPLALTARAVVEAHRVLVLTSPDHVDAVRSALPGATVRTPSDVDLTDDDTARASLVAWDPSGFDAIVCARAPAAHLGEDPLCELAFAVCRWAYPRIRAGEVAVGVACAGGVDPDGRLHPGSGALAGFVKALARELPAATCRAVTSDAGLRDSLDVLGRELAAGPCPVDPEAIYVRGVRHVQVLREQVAVDGVGAARVGPDTRVLATGGGSGVTAALVVALAERHRMPVVVLGRSDPADAPAEVVALDDDGFAAYETAWYRDARARAPDTALGALRTQFGRLAAARETARTMKRLTELCGADRVAYRAVDLTDAGAVVRFVRSLGPGGLPDLIVHGAGVQFSGALDRKRLVDLRATLATKVGGLEVLLGAMSDLAPDHQPDVHVLGSMFSLLGNDGQHEYGAANEVLHRLAGAGGHFSGIAWSGWRSVGMTAGSEYAFVAKRRRLRPLAVPEGQELFLDAIARRDGPPLVLPASAAEAAWSGIPVRPQLLATYGADAASHPFVDHHRLGGQPVLAGAFELELVVRALVDACPGWVAVSANDLRWERFARIAASPPVPAPYRVEATALSRAPGRRRVEVRLVSDFVHASGAVLNRGVVHFRAVVELQRAAPELPGHPVGWRGPGVPIARDPYCADDSAVRLSGPFACLQALEVGPDGQRARWRFDDPSVLDAIGHHALPAMLADAACRVAMIRLPTDDDTGPNTPIPYRCRRCAMAPGSNDRSLVRDHAEIEIVAGVNRRVAGRDGLRQHAAWSVARDVRTGRTLLRLDGLLARFAPVAPADLPHAPMRPAIGAENSTPVERM